MKSISIKNFPINLGHYNNFISEIMALAKSATSSYVCVANVHMFIESCRYKTFAKVIQSADLVTPDGMPLVWALKLLYKIKQDRVAGMDLISDLLQEAQKDEVPVFLYGGTNTMLNKADALIKNQFPKLQIAGMYSPPFRPLMDSESEEISKEINNSNAKIVLVILGCPKQELWMASMKGKINAVMIGIGGALPVLVGMQKRAPVWMQNNGLEWLFRLCQEPGRLFKRYAITNSLFLWMLFKELIQVRLIKPFKVSAS